jgi:transcriptional regulator GlxA family with amidase domain
LLKLRVSVHASLPALFRAETGQSPAKTIENLWLEARFMLDQGRLSVEEIARATGFGDRERMRRSFLHTSDKRRKADATLRTRLLELSIRV